MALPVVWTQNAIEDYQIVVDYLLKEWPLYVAENFVSIIEKRTNILGIYPNIGVASKKDPSIRSIVVTKHNKLYYRITSVKIEILNIFDTRQNPEKNLFQ